LNLFCFGTYAPTFLIFIFYYKPNLNLLNILFYIETSLTVLYCSHDTCLKQVL
jgi:hypothetical protein